MRHAIEDALDQCSAGFGCWPRVNLAGHQHLFQHLALADQTFHTNRTHVIIGGQSGTAWDYSDLIRCRAVIQDHKVFGQSNMSAAVTTVSRHGYVRLLRKKDGVGDMGWDVDLQWYPDEAPAKIGGPTTLCTP